VIATDRHWALFVDWCLSQDRELEAITPEAVESFLSAAPAAASTQRSRVESIRLNLESRGVFASIGRPPAVQTIEVFQSTESLGQALAQIPKSGSPRGLRGRRDAWLLVLIGHLKMSRRQASAVSGDAIELFPHLTVAGHVIERSDMADVCAACAIYRWLKVLGPAARGYRSDVAEILHPRFAGDPGHACETGLDGEWRLADTLLPGIDRHGWLAGNPLSLDAISDIVALRRIVRDVPQETAQRAPSAGRYAEASSQELADAYDDVDRRLAALLARTKAMLGESEEIHDTLSGYGF
jgi:hypothetical protein